MTLHVPSEQTQQNQADTEGIMYGVIIGFSCIFVFLFLLPNVYLCLLHSFERRRQKPLTLEQLILKQTAPEIQQPEVKNKSQCLTPALRESMYSEFSDRALSEARFFQQNILPSETNSHLESTKGTTEHSMQRSNKRKVDMFKLNATLPNVSDASQSLMNELEVSTYPQSSLTRLVNCFNFAEMHHHIWGTKARPWDDRELDMFDGFKLISFVMTSTAQTGYSLLLTFIIDLL